MFVLLEFVLLWCSKLVAAEGGSIEIVLCEWLSYER
jgi:hypothetical protein